MTGRIVEAHVQSKFRIPMPGISATAVINRAAVELVEVSPGRYLVGVTDLLRGPEHRDKGSWALGPDGGEEAEIAGRRWEILTGLVRPEELERA